MLRILRSKKIAKRVLLGLLIIIIPAFVLWGAGSFTNRPQPIGYIGGAKVMTDSLNESVDGIRAELLMTYFNNYQVYSSTVRNKDLLLKMAWDRLIMLEAVKKTKIKISNNKLMTFIATHPLFLRDGAFTQETYEYLTTKVLGMEPRDFEERTRENLAIKELQKNICKDITVDDSEITELFHKANDKIDITYLMLPKETKLDILAVYDQIKKHPDEMEETAKENDLETSKMKSVGISDYIENAGPASIIFERALTQSKPGLLEPLNVPKGTLFVRLDKLHPADPTLLEQQKEILTKRLEMQKRSEALSKWQKTDAPKSRLLKPLTNPSKSS